MLNAFTMEKKYNYPQDLIIGMMCPHEEIY